MIDEKLKEFFNKFPHIKENKPLQNTLSKKNQQPNKKRNSAWCKSGRSRTKSTFKFN